MASPLNYCGAGVGLRSEHREEVLSLSESCLLEVIPDHFFSRPDEIEAFAARAPLVMHDVGLSLGTTGPLDEKARGRLKKIRSLADVSRPRLFSEHLSATRSSDGIELGHLCPVQYTKESLESFCTKVNQVQDLLGMRIALENIAETFLMPGSEMNEAEFLTELCQRTGAGVLLDLTNLLYNSWNHGFSAEERLAQFPLEHVLQLHLAGGVQRGGRWVDSHSAPIGEETWALLRHFSRLVAAGRCADLIGVIIERDSHLPSLHELLEEARKAELVLSVTNDEAVAS